MTNLIYGLGEKIPTKKLILFALQMMLSVFVATVLIANICGVAVSGALVGAGLATLIYALITQGKSPMFVSNSGAFVAPVVAALALGGYNAVAIGGLTTCIIYCVFGFIFSKIPAEKIYKIFPRSLIGAVTVVIGINLMPFILEYVKVDDKISPWMTFIALFTMSIVIICSHYAKGIMKIIPFLVGTLSGYLLSALLTITGVYPIIDFEPFKNIGLFQVPDFAFTHFSSFSGSIILPIVVMYIAFTVSAMMEALSDHAALSGIIGVDLYKTPGLAKIFYGEGAANLVGSLVGGLGICSYGEGVACVGFSKVASVRVTSLAAFFLVTLGFLEPIQIFISSIPSCVFAGSAIILYGFIACSGMKMLQQVDLNINKNLITVSVVLSLGISGLVIGGGNFTLTTTALALIAGVVLNLILKDK